MSSPELSSHLPSDAAAFRAPEFSPEQASSELPATPESLPLEEQVIDAALEEMIDHALVRMNEGSNGVIFRMNIQEVAPSSLQTLEKVGVTFEQERVAKILKIYREGEGKREFDMQQRAQRLLAAQPEATVAEVPTAHFFRDMPVTEHTRPILRQLHSAFERDRRLEVIIMDAFQGEDLSVGLMREVMRRHPSLSHLAAEADTIPAEDVLREVYNVVGTREEESSSPAALLPEERVRKERQAYLKQMQYVYGALDRLGFQLRPDVVTRLKQTFQTLHANGFVHRDVHERNIMVNGSLGIDAAEAPKLALIDFGTARQDAGPVTPELYQELNPDGTVHERYPDDLAVVRLLERLTLPPGLRAPETQRLLTSLRSLEKRISTTADPRWTGLLQETRDAMAKGTIDLQRVFDSPPVGKKLEPFLASVNLLAGEHPEMISAVREFLQKYKTTASRAQAVQIDRYLLANGWSSSTPNEKSREQARG